jgi:lipoxygenase
LSFSAYFWNQIAVRKFRANRPAEIPVPRDGDRPIQAVSLASQFPAIPISNIKVGDHVPADEAALFKYYFYEFQVGMYGVLPPNEPGLPSIDADPQKALDNAYTAAHRSCFPAPVLPPEYQGVVDLGSLAVAGPYACFLVRAPEGGFQWDLTQLAGYEHHDGLRSLGVRVLFRVDENARKLTAVRIDSELGACAPTDPNWEAAKRLALCAATTHTSLIRHFNWVHLAAGGPFAIATRNCLPANHPLRRLLWPHMFGTQYSNQLITKGQMVDGGDFETIFSFTLKGMYKLFEDSYEQFDIAVLDPELDAEHRGIKDAGFETPALANRKAHFDVMHAHAVNYLQLYYASDADLRADTAVAAWTSALNEMVPNGVAAVLGTGVTLDGLTRLTAVLIYMATVEHEILGTGLWNYQMWSHVQPVRVYKNGQREPVDVYQRLVNANFNLNVSRAQLLQDFSYLALDENGATAFRKFNTDLQELQRRLDGEPFKYWKIYPKILEANINA